RWRSWWAACPGDRGGNRRPADPSEEARRTWGHLLSQPDLHGFGIDDIGLDGAIADAVDHPDQLALGTIFQKPARRRNGDGALAQNDVHALATLRHDRATDGVF